MSGRLDRFLILCLLGAILFGVSLPLFWMISCSLRPFAEIYASPPILLPRNITFSNYTELFRLTNFLIYFKNSLIIALGTTFLTMVLSTLGAFSLARFHYRGKEVISFLVLFTYVVPAILLLIPIFLLLAKVGLVNTYTGMIIANTTFCLPFGLWLMRGFFQGIPKELEESGMIDGAGRFKIFLDILLPMAVPGIIAVSIFTFILAWNEYLFALVILTKESMKTLPVGIAQFADATSVEWGLIMAASVMATLPILLLFAFPQRFLIQGFGSGGLKG
jgi:multiple sugar transport system permease protein